MTTGSTRLRRRPPRTKRIRIITRARLLIALMVIVVVAAILQVTPATRWVIAAGDIHRPGSLKDQLAAGPTDQEHWMVRVTVRERDQGNIELGQTMRIDVSAHPSTLEATVIYIAETIERPATGDGFFIVIGRVDHMTDAYLNHPPKQGATVDASIDTGRTTLLRRLLGF
ncbi:MAG: hypothetical protein CMJ49_10830 [Planctomycetaceae bacterium]|nr:hypothetical protein [Planctomycetaceae bacterium]